MMTKMLHMITNFFDSSLSNYWVKIKDTKQLLRRKKSLNKNNCPGTNLVVVPPKVCDSTYAESPQKYNQKDHILGDIDPSTCLKLSLSTRLRAHLHRLVQPAFSAFSSLCLVSQPVTLLINVSCLINLRIGHARSFVNS